MSEPTPVFIVSPPRAGATLLTRILNASGMSFAGESDEFLGRVRGMTALRKDLVNASLEETWPRYGLTASPSRWEDVVPSLLAGWVNPKPEAAFYGLRTVFSGKGSWVDSVDWWGWMLRTWPTSKIIFLTRDRSEVEISMLATPAMQWIPKYGRCVGCCGENAKLSMDHMRSFNDMNPLRTLVVDYEALKNFQEIADALLPFGMEISKEGWVREVNTVLGSRRSNVTLPSIFRPVEPKPVCDFTTFDVLMAHGVVEDETSSETVAPTGEVLDFATFDKIHAKREDEDEEDETMADLIPIHDRLTPRLKKNQEPWVGSLEIHTLRYGEGIPWLEACAPTLDDYSARHGIPMTIWGNDFPQYPHPKFCVVDMMQRFLEGSSEFMMYVDADIFIHPLAPLPELQPGMTIKVDVKVFNRGWRDWVLENFQTEIPADFKHRNAGIWICDRESASRMLAVIAEPYIEAIMEQHHWNYWLFLAEANGMQLNQLSPVWNSWGKSGDTAWFYHLASQRKMAKLKDLRKRAKLPSPPAVLPDLLPEPPVGSRAIVIPWSRERAEGRELIYAVRSIVDHFEDKECPIYILSEDVPFDLFDFEEGARIRHFKAPSYADALFAGIQLAEWILWFNDDICLMKPCGWDDFEAALVQHDVAEEDIVETLRKTNLWHSNRARLMANFHHQGRKDLKNFSTHTPYLYQREKALEALRMCGLYHKVAFESAYYNLHVGPTKPAKGYRTTDPLNPTALFLNYNHGNFTKEFENKLSSRFPVPAPFEYVEPVNFARLFNPARYYAPYKTMPMAADERHIQMLHATACLPSVRSAVEIGSFDGKSTAALIEAVNIGELDILHIVEINPREELKRIIALADYPERVILHTKPYWQTDIGVTDMVFIDGDHGAGALADGMRALAWHVPIIAMHDTSLNYPWASAIAGSIAMAKILREMPDRHWMEDDVPRKGYGTDRGFFVSAPVGLELGSIMAVNDVPFHDSEVPEFVWMTTPVSGVPHAQELRDTNPDVVIHVCENEEFADPELRKKAWWNTDLRILDWWLANRHRVRSSSVVFLEYDVWFSARWQDVWEGEVKGISAPKVANRKSNDWQWFSEVKHLPRYLRPHATGVLPMAALRISRECLDALCDTRFHKVFRTARRPVYCEVRLATVAAYLGFPVEACHGLRRVDWRRDFVVDVGDGGVWHPVKTSPPPRSS